MKIAIISDVHGNITALNEAFKDIEKRNVDKIFCLGDMIIKCSSPYECVEKISKNCEVIIKGNCEESGVSKPKIKEHLWNRAKLSDAQRKMIENLPYSYDFYISGYKVRLMHASPRSVHEKSYYFNANDGFYDRMKEMFKNNDYLGKNLGEEPDIVIFGHIHRPMILRIENKMLINPGAISNTSYIITKNNKSYTLGSYLILDGDFGSKEISTLSYELIKFPYDNMEEARKIRNLDMPNKEEAAIELETGKYFNRRPLILKENLQNISFDN